MLWRFNLLEELEALGPERMEAWIANARLRRYERGDRLPGRNEGFDGIHLIKRGCVRIEAVVEEGKRIVLDRYEDGEALGVRDWFDPNAKPPLVWIVEQPSEIWSIDRRGIERFLHGDHGEIRALLEHAAQVRALHVRFAVHPLFRLLAPEERRALLQEGTILAVPAGDYLVREGAPNEKLFFVLEGRFAIERGGKKIAEKQPDELIGEVSVLGFSPTASVRALEWSEVLVLPREAVLKACAQSPEFAAHLADFDLKISAPSSR